MNRSQTENRNGLWRSQNEFEVARSCQKEKNRSGKYKQFPTCNRINNKFYDEVQCKKDYCYCVNIVTGNELLPKRRTLSATETEFICSGTSCLDTYYNAHPTAIVTACDNLGLYTSIQINLMTGQIWQEISTEYEYENEYENEYKNERFSERDYEEEEYESTIQHDEYRNNKNEPELFHEEELEIVYEEELDIVYEEEPRLQIYNEAIEQQNYEEPNYEEEPNYDEEPNEVNDLEDFKNWKNIFAEYIF